MLLILFFKTDLNPQLRFNLLSPQNYHIYWNEFILKKLPVHQAVFRIRIHNNPDQAPLSFGIRSESRRKNNEEIKNKDLN